MINKTEHINNLHSRKSNTQYFKETPAKDWSFEGYNKYIIEQSRRPPRLSTTSSKFRACLNELSALADLNEECKNKLEKLTEEFNEPEPHSKEGKKSPTPNTFNNYGTITTGGDFNNGSITVFNNKKPVEEQGESSKSTGITDGYYADKSSTSSEEISEDADSDYNARESTPSTDVSQGIRKTPSPVMKDYLISSNKNNMINIERLKAKWVLQDGYDMSAACINRRNELVEECGDCRRVLKPDEELLINGIVLLDGDFNSNIIQADVYDKAFKEVKDTYSKYEDDKFHLYEQDIFKFSQLMTKGDFTEAKSLVDDSNLHVDLKMVLFSLSRSYCSGYSVESANESSIVKDCITPVLDYTFPNSRIYTTYGADKGITESKKRFIDIDPSLTNHVRKGDFSVVSNQSNHLIFALESKSEGSKDKSKGDIIKMARYMKDTIDSIEADGFKRLAIAGMITSGTDCCNYIMEHTYDYIYTLYKQDPFYIPVNHHDMYRINSMFPLMFQLKNILQVTFTELSKLEHQRNDPVTLKKLKTYHTPTQVPNARIKKVNLQTVKKASRKLF